MPPFRDRIGTLAVVALILLGACTMRSAIDTMTSPEDRSFADAMVAHLRQGDADWLQPRFDPQLWAESGKRIGEVPGFFPAEAGTTELVGFNISTRNSGGVTERTKEFTLVTESGGRWTVTTFRTYAAGGPEQVVQWRVVPHATPPPELTVIRTFDALIPWIRAGIVVMILLAGSLIFWLVRRSRRKRA